jgi:hypothetical protein
MISPPQIFSNFRKSLIYLFFCSTFLSGFVAGCKGSTRSDQKVSTGHRVEIVKGKDQFKLLRNGEPYFIKGAAGYTRYQQLKMHGGNSIRVWDTSDASRILDQAHQLGLTVCLGVWMTREKEGFNYDDKRAVEKQFLQIKRDVLKYKDHPALLMWNIGNEISSEATNIRVWDAVNDIARMIHEIDPNHPTSTTIMNVDYRILRIIKNRCPEIDIVALNSYGGLHNLSERMRQSAWDGPYYIGEFGAKGYWEADRTSWDQPIEQHSSEKASFIRSNYENNILPAKDRCIGAYIFHWGQKQEKTHTWFSLFTQEGEKTEAVDMIRFLWSGTWPENRAPLIMSITSDSKDLTKEFIVLPGSSHQLEVSAFDPEEDLLQYSWDLYSEINTRDGATFRHKKPKRVGGSEEPVSEGAFTWTAPEKHGTYRLFISIKDGNKNIATANLPILVSDASPAGSALHSHKNSSLPTHLARGQNY